MCNCVCEHRILIDIDLLNHHFTQFVTWTDCILTLLFSRLCWTGRGRSTVLCPIRTILPRPCRGQDRWRQHLQYRPCSSAGCAGRPNSAASSGPPCVAGSPRAGCHSQPAAGAGYSKTHHSQVHSCHTPSHQTHFHHPNTSQTYLNPSSTNSTSTRDTRCPFPRSQVSHIWTYWDIFATDWSWPIQVSDKIWAWTDQQTDSSTTCTTSNP